jgi:hypothetical protein
MSSQHTKSKKTKVETSKDENTTSQVKLKPGVVWSKERIQKAKDNHYYVRIINGRIRQFLLSGAMNHWKVEKNEANVYLPDVRLLGSEDELKALLSKSDYSETEIESFFENCYSLDNFNQDRSEDFEKELEELKEYRKSKSKSVKPEKNVRVTNVMKNLNLNQKSQPHLSTKKKLQMQKNQIIQEKLKSLPEDYVIDVSSMKDDGTRIKKRKIENIKNQYGNVSKIPIVSSDESKYETILLLLDYNDEEMIELLNDFKRDRNEKLEHKKLAREQVKQNSKPKEKSTKSEVKEKETSKSEAKETPKKETPKKETPKKETKEALKKEEPPKESPKDDSKKLTREELLKKAKSKITSTKPQNKK